ncbi:MULTISPECIES: D-alanyl-D-alanine carboxypeptidase family protein [Subtercola]|uniref:D-alanyl-D-alanine carboxypeptidase n=1 Tax=Subtercola vilae TaxID=2056433 RepID=A0A4T2CAD4_9MICO|nr:MULTISPECIES: D-alanyl-D-alanine carboxypeptidase [Subtercola]MEA9986410.1 D-alanyl-D-alanine carboxypeptidase [Subtercola sp. RTI3]TIH40341.1 D-alanyl-D-alanine carboxypeptidase [Subtercola vilae]
MPVSRRTLLTRRSVVLVVALVVIAGGIYVPVVLTAAAPAASATLAVPAVAPAAEAVVSTPAAGSSAIALTGSSTILASSGSTTPVPIASVTKILTTLVVLEAKPLTLTDNGPNITLTEADLAILGQTQAEGGSYVLVNVGQVLTERQILDIMLLESANNYSETIAIWAFGSLDNYLTAARAFIAAHNLSGTTVVDSSGLNPASRSTTTDLLTLASLAEANPVLKAIVSTANETVPGLSPLTNTNTLLGSDGIDGMKTGTTDEAGSCLLFSADFTVGGTTLSVVGVVLGAASSADARASVTALLDTAKKGFTVVQLATAGEVVGSYSTVWGSTAPIVASESASTVVWSNSAVSVRSAVTPLSETDPAAATPAGTLTYTVAGPVESTVVTVPLALGAALPGPDGAWRLAHPGELLG